MADLKALFEQAQKDVKTLSKKPSNEDLLTLYSRSEALYGAEAGTRGPRPLALMLKDMGIALEVARDTRTPAPLWGLAQQLWRMADHAAGCLATRLS